MKIFKVTVQLIIEAKDGDEVTDKVSACLTENLQHNGEIIDWAYLKEERDSPNFNLIIEPIIETKLKRKKYKEGDAF